MSRWYRARVDPTPYVREAGYAERYRDRRFTSGSGPVTDHRERSILRELLARCSPKNGMWLDAPSGAGRMSSELPGHVVQLDRDFEMVRAIPTGERRICACSTQLPFSDHAFAGALCCRLLQHLPLRAERVAVLRELHRVATGPVVATFFDAMSLQHARRVMRRAMGKKRSGRSAITRAQFVSEAREAGFARIEFRASMRFLGEQTFALLQR